MAVGTVEREYLGKAAEDLVLGSVMLKVIVPELTPALSGGFQAATETQTVSLMSPTGTATASTVRTANHIVAEYRGDDQNMYPPQVKLNEQVLVFKVAGSDKWRWKPYGRDAHMRGLDRRRTSVSNVPGDTVVEKDDSNTYWNEINTIDGVATLIATSKSNGETYSYKFEVQARGGQIILADDTGNMFYMNSKEKMVQLVSADQASVTVKEKDVFIAAPRDVTIKAERQVVFSAPVVTFDGQHGDGAMAINTKGATIAADDTLVLKGGSILLDGAVKAPGTVVTGQMRSEGYATGSVGAAYASPTTSVESGAGTTGSNTPDTAATNGSNRHAAAVEQLQEMASLLVTCLDEIKGAIGVPSTNYQRLTQLAAQAKMTTMKGDAA